MAATTVTIYVGAAATGVTFTPSSALTSLGGGSYSATAALTVGEVLGTIAVQPSGWNGQISLSGANAADFMLNGLQLEAAVAVALGNTVAVTITATP